MRISPSNLPLMMISTWNSCIMNQLHILCQLLVAELCTHYWKSKNPLLISYHQSSPKSLAMVKVRANCSKYGTKERWDQYMIFLWRQKKKVKANLNCWWAGERWSRVELMAERDARCQPLYCSIRPLAVRVERRLVHDRLDAAGFVF